MLKASAGGGGRGMRIVNHARDFESEFAIASDEALKAFGDGAMMVEKLIERPRHIELQFIADRNGNVACLFERECSIQRRHQKLIEEAPSPAMTTDLWPKMREAVEALVRASGYTNAGTAEFMFDETSGEFYFLEVNARLQVEHPVTEAITGLDLVKWQLRIADGESLRLPPELASGERSGIKGHAIEARIVAEDPAAGFLPSVGKILAWAEPKRPGIRVDTGYTAGAIVPRYYDSLLAKVVSYGEDRLEAIDRLVAALMDFHVLGIRTNVAFLLDVLRHPEFRAGRIDTGFLSREFAHWEAPKDIPAELPLIASHAVAVRLSEVTAASQGIWDAADGFRNAVGGR
jgi:3-methylcrotonyl-CoA carboxylase alpha subunit